MIFSFTMQFKLPCEAMKPVQFLRLATLLMLVATTRCEKKQPQSPTPEASPVSAADIVGKSWVPTGAGGYVELSFTEKTAKFELNFEGQACGLADYKITAQGIEIGKTRRCPVEDFVGLREQEAQTCKYVTDPKAIQHTILLKCKNETFGRADSLVKTGTKIQHEGLDLVSEGWVAAETVTPAKFRSRPDKGAPTIAYDPGNGIEGSKPKTDVIPAGATIRLIARTPEKFKVEKWENYWYLVEIYGLENYRGWVFGELLKKK